METEYEIKGLLQTLKETGIKGVMKYSNVIILNHLMERGILPETRDKLVKSLKENTVMSYGEIMSLITEHERWKKYLPSYTHQLNRKLDRINEEYDTVRPYQYVGHRLIGLVKHPSDRDFINIMDGLKGGNTLLGRINTNTWSVTWSNINIEPEISSWIKEHIHDLKKEELLNII